ncbi:unnamed protein product [Candida verbasci]|uniref:HIT-type domain-containing protein n=1 Tax=Candida verbasci TaxID=1227364 RepID=A0A9W4TW54_9ASCO|nr:unnamed protein product [Candida verbasci]
MLCQICNTNESKYKCPKCNIPYCSLACYKSESHKEPEQIEKPKSNKIEIASDINSNSKFDKFLKDSKIQYLLNEPVLQFHLLTLVKILNDDQGNFVSKGLNHDQKLDVLNLKLQDLRAGGVEENEAIEEFVQRIFELDQEES